MDASAFSHLVSLASTYGYVFVFIIMIIEGPLITIAAAFAAAAGIFNVYIIFILAVIADAEGDLVYYIIGYWGRIKFVEKYGKYIGLTPKRVRKMEALLSKNAWRTLLIAKTTPFLPTVGLITAGITKMPFKKYAKIVALIILPKTLLYVLIGYYSGKIHNLAMDYFHYGNYAIITAVILIIFIDYLIRKIARAASSRFRERLSNEL